MSLGLLVVPFVVGIIVVMKEWQSIKDCLLPCVLCCEEMPKRCGMTQIWLWLIPGLCLTVSGVYSMHTNAYFAVTLLKDTLVCNGGRAYSVVSFLWLLSLGELVLALLYSHPVPYCCLPQTDGIDFRLHILRNPRNNKPSEVRWASLAKVWKIDNWTATFAESLLLLAPCVKWSSLAGLTNAYFFKQITTLSDFHWTQRGVDFMLDGAWPAEHIKSCPASKTIALSNHQKSIIQDKLHLSLAQCENQGFVNKGAPVDWDRCWEHRCVRRLLIVLRASSRRALVSVVPLSFQFLGQIQALDRTILLQQEVPPLLLCTVIMNFMTYVFEEVVQMMKVYQLGAVLSTTQIPVTTFRNELSEGRDLSKLDQMQCSVLSCSRALEKKRYNNVLRDQLCPHHYNGSGFIEEFDTCVRLRRWTLLLGAVSFAVVVVAVAMGPRIADLVKAAD